MKLTRHTDNALRCLTLLALEPGRAITVGEIAQRMHMSADHLFKVVGRLAELGYVTTTRGRQGGVRLARAAAQIRIGRVVRETEEDFALVECFSADETQCPIAPACVLATSLDRALKAFFGVLDEITLETLVQQPRRLEKLVRNR
ncbi:MAG TPA: Rrf2 family transcriptional regulator [Gemmatimonadaceae bacterium]|nr:Rrf2 family transcriptional regulator [Gemmatimonadaceae bacterium]